MLIEITIDTNNTNYNQDKHPYNEDLWNIIVPNIKYLGNSEGLQSSEEIDWEITKQQFKNGNGHCIQQKTGGYVAAYEYESLYFEEEFLKSVANFTYPRQNLSNLMAEICIKNKLKENERSK